jgi:hypothetical protein
MDDIYIFKIFYFVTRFYRANTLIFNIKIPLKMTMNWNTVVGQNIGNTRKPRNGICVGNTECFFFSLFTLFSARANILLIVLSDSPDFVKGQIVSARLSGASVTKLLHY